MRRAVETARRYTSWDRARWPPLRPQVRGSQTITTSGTADRPRIRRIWIWGTSHLDSMWTSPGIARILNVSVLRGALQLHYRRDGPAAPQLRAGLRRLDGVRCIDGR